MTREELDLIRKRAEAATSGPWWVEHYAKRDSVIVYGEKGNPSETFDLIEKYEMGDYDFIAAAREDIPALLDEVERLREALKEAQQHLHHEVCIYESPHHESCDRAREALGEK